MILCLLLAALSAADVAAIRETTSGFFEAWNRGDVPDLVAHWTSDATIVDPDGSAAHGTAELLKLFTARRTQAAGSTEHLETLQARKLGRGLAWVDAELSVVPEPGAPVLRWRLVGVVRKDGGKWRWHEGAPYPKAVAR